MRGWLARMDGRSNEEIESQQRIYERLSNSIANISTTRFLLIRKPLFAAHSQLCSSTTDNASVISSCVV